MAKVFFNFFIVERALAQLFDGVYAQYDLTTKQWLVLAVATNIERPTMQNVARALRTSHQNVKVIAMSMVRQGYVRLEKDPADRRTTLIMPAERLAELGSARGDKDEQDMALLFQDFSGEELAHLDQSLDKLLAQIDTVRNKLV